MPSPFAKLASFVRKNSFLFLRHHPTCEQFDDHVFTIKGRAFCIGCFVGFPAMFLSALVLVLAGGFGLHPSVLFWGGTITFTVLMALHASHVIKRKRLKIVSRAIIGVGLGAFTAAVLLVEGWLLAKLVLLYLVYQFYVIITSYFRIRGMARTCDACEHEARWETCPGMYGPRDGDPAGASV